MIVIIQGKRAATPEEVEEARGEYRSYIKITIDIEKEIIAIGGEYHADAEKVLLQQGLRQKNIWGGGLNLETGMFETNAIVNLRAGRNDSTEILDPRKREKFFKLAKIALGGYVKK